MQMNEMFFIFSFKGNLIFCFSQGVNSVRRHASLFLVLRRRDYFDLKEFERLQ